MSSSAGEAAYEEWRARTVRKSPARWASLVVEEKDAWEAAARGAIKFVAAPHLPLSGATDPAPPPDDDCDE